MWPRAFALAEIGWNGTETKNYGEFKRRALVQADRLRDVEGMHPFDLRR